jgi:hypothetical protein
MCIRICLLLLLTQAGYGQAFTFQDTPWLGTVKPAQGSVNTQNLLALYKFDEGSGSTAIDSSGNGETGTEIGSPTYVTGKVGPYALQFTTNQYVDTENFADSLGYMTVTCWFKTSTPLAGQKDVNGIGYELAIVSKVGTNGIQKGTGWFLALSSDFVTSGLTFQLQNDNGAYGIYQYSTNAVNDGKWHFAACVVSNVMSGNLAYGSTANVALYLDGNIQTEYATAEGGWFGNSTYGVTGYSNTNHVRIANDYGGDKGQPQFFPGVVDDVRIYATNLPVSVLQGIYNGTE